MIIYEIPGPPIPLQRHRHSGKKCYDPQKKEKDHQRWLIKPLLNGFEAIKMPIKLVVEYHMPIPKRYSQKGALELLLHPHFTKPDLSNLIKFTEDTFNGILWKDDSLIAEIEASKFYATEPKTIIRIVNILDGKISRLVYVSKEDGSLILKR